MGKTEKGALFLDPALTSPYDFFQYWRNVQDADLRRFLLMFTFLPVEECEQLCAGGKNPNEGKERLAWELTVLIHGKDEAGAFVGTAGAAPAADGAAALTPFTDVGALVGVESLNERGELLLRAGKKRYCRVIAV
jgi:tyrosyl-tRNA synthetase